eukprot:750572-Hanusia_phi.AAC.5
MEQRCTEEEGGKGLTSSRMRMAENVFICGGGSLFPGFKQRIEYEIRCLLPMGANLNVNILLSR